jgi:hypothetical protein
MLPKVVAVISDDLPRIVDALSQRNVRRSTGDNIYGDVVARAVEEAMIVALGVY